MKLIFKNESSEINDLLGFIDADIYLDKIRTEVYSATSNLIKLIGAEAYDYGISLYEKEEVDQTAEDKFLIQAIQHAIITEAYRIYAPSGDISHTKNGRKMRHTDNEKAAFEWMINRDNEALEKRHYRALDTLLNWLDDNDPTLSADPVLKWTGTDAFKKTHKLFVRTTADFEEYFSIDSRFLLMKLAPGLYKAERDLIKPRIGKVLFDKLKAAVLAAEAMDEYLLNLIKEVCVYYSLAWAIPRLRVSLLPDGVLQQFSSDRAGTKASKPGEFKEADLAVQSFKEDTDRALLRIEEYLKPEPTPEELIEGSVQPEVSFDEDDSFAST